MPLKYFFAAALLLCSFSALSQYNQSSGPPSGKFPAENFAPTRNPLDRIQIDQFKIDPNFRFKVEGKMDSSVLRLGENLEGQTTEDTTCYFIRSFQVAREPGSDSTYPVGSSTCQPASRYRLKSANIRQSSNDR